MEDFYPKLNNFDAEADALTKTQSESSSRRFLSKIKMPMPTCGQESIFQQIL